MTQTSNRFFAPGAEFARIERMFGADRFSRDARGLGDDGFLWNPASGSPAAEGGDQTWVAASDASVEGVHYRLDWVAPAEAVRKALRANLSDINAMGGRTRFVLFNLGARADWGADVYDAIGGVLREEEARHGFRVIGGDTTTVPGPGFFSFAVMGSVEGTPLLRSTVRSGHRIYVSGSLGGSSAGLEILTARATGGAASVGGELSDASARSLVRAHLEPEPPLELGPLLASLRRGPADASDSKAIGALDISDGLSSEAWHLARQSGCALVLDPGKIPLHPALAGFSAARKRDYALHGGEEYQLLFTGEFSPEELESMRRAAPVTEIGVVEAGEGVFLREDGATHPLASGGYSHGGKAG
jgi:thiamine-monophosphate kinase